MPSLKERFYAKVSPEPNTGCHLWTAATNWKYGHIRIGGKRGRVMKAHRVAWMLAGNPDPGDGLVLLHACDNTLCVNPAHLRVGTQVDNVHDRDSKGRQARLKGERNGFAKLTEEQVREIRSRYAAGESQYALGRSYGVARTTITWVVSGGAWSHVAAR